MIALLAWPALAAASPPPVSGVSQYVEEIPTASGPSTEGAGPVPSGAPITLSERTDQALAKRGDEQAQRLKSVATARRYGAPQSRLPKTSERLATDAPADATMPSAGQLASAAGGQSAGLILLLTGTAVAIGAWALARARR